MKKKIIFILTIIFAFTNLALADGELTTPIKKDTIVGKNHLTNKSITATQYIFSKSVESIIKDSSTNLFLLKLDVIYWINHECNKKWLSIAGYNGKSNTVIWQHDADSTDNYIPLNNSYIILNSNNFKEINSSTGATEWENKGGIYYINKSKTIGLYYHSNSKTSKNIQGINLKTGEPDWKRKISLDTWDGVCTLNDSTSLISSSGLHTVNLFNGKGWDYNVKTSIFTNDIDCSVDPLSVLGLISVGYTFGMLGGIFVSAGFPETMRLQTTSGEVNGISSHPLLYNQSIYYAYQDSIVSLDKATGKTNWHYPLPSDMVSNSYLFIKNNDLYMINYGLAFLGKTPVGYGNPFIASYDLNTGHQKTMLVLNIKNADQITDIHFRGDSLYIAFKNRVLLYRFFNADEKESDKFDKNMGITQNFLSEKFYVKVNDSIYKSIYEANPHNIFICTKNKKVTKLGLDLTIQGEQETEGLYQSIYFWNNYIVLYKENEGCRIIDKKGNLITSINLPGKMYLMGDFLYIIKDNSLIPGDKNKPKTKEQEENERFYIQKPNSLIEIDLKQLLDLTNNELNKK